MFDVGFWELGLIGVVALVIIGPERLPAVARSVGRWVGGAQRFVSSVKTDIDKEINKNEGLKQLIEEQKELKETHEILENSVSDLKQAASIPSSSSAPVSKPAASVADKSITNNTSAPDSTAAQTDSSKPATEKSGVEDK